MAATTAYVLVGTAFSVFFLRQYYKFKWGKCKSKCRLDGKTVIITGANSGLGKITALELAKRGARVILACRDLVGAARTATEIHGAISNGRCELVVRHLDLSSFASIRQFSQEILDSEPRLDILINNAGVGWCPFTLTANGIETQFAVNHLGHFLLTNLLLERISKSTPSRVITVSSSLYRNGKLDFDDIIHPDESKYDAGRAYRNSKLANILFARELARRVKGKAIDSLALCPGMVLTNLGRHRRLSVWQKLALSILAVVIIRTPWQGCQTILHCAVSDEVAGHNGGFFQNCKPAQLRPVALDNENARQLWKISTELTGLSDNKSETSEEKIN